jgi:CHAT domain-containing protein
MIVYLLSYPLVALLPAMLKHAYKLLFASTLGICLWFSQPVFSQQVSPGQQISPGQQVQQGIEQYQQQDYSGAIATWKQALERYQSAQDRPNSAIVLENLARLSQTIGQQADAIAYWERAINLYRQVQNPQALNRAMTEQAQVYNRLGQHRQAISLLCGWESEVTNCFNESSLAIARQIQDATGQIAALGSLGEAYRDRGAYNPAINAFEQALKIARDHSDQRFQSILLTNLGKGYADRAQLSYRQAILAADIGQTNSAKTFEEEGLKDDQKALQFFQESLFLPMTLQDVSLHFDSLMNAIPSAHRTQKTTLAIEQTQQAIALLDQLPDTQAKVYVAIDLVGLLRPTSTQETFSRLTCPTDHPQTKPLLEKALMIAQRIGDRRSQSFALGELGHLYECQQNYASALAFTQQARQMAEQHPDSLYLWEWQAGRIFKAQAQPNAVTIPIYEQAIATLETIRNDILTTKRDLQFDLRDTIKPLYQDLIAMRLAEGKPGKLLLPDSSEQGNLNATVKTLDSLRLAELQNYFGNDCAVNSLIEETAASQKAEQSVAVFNSVILADRTAIVVKFPNGQQQLEWIRDPDGTFVDQATLKETVNQYRKKLASRIDVTVGYDTQLSQQLYSWMIAPFADTLQATQPKTLVFVQDGILRSVPMAALYDGNQFLIEQYAIANTPSLRLTNFQPFQRNNLRALAVGLTEPVSIDGQDFTPLPGVETEIQWVQTNLPGSKTLIDQDFTRREFQQELSRTNYPIVHVATHGKFGTDPQNTFLVTGDSTKLTINVLDTILRSIDPDHRIELLMLTACQTSVGDERAALGLAGVAAQAGVKSVLASLWSVDDQATAELVKEFYTALQSQSVSKAEALQIAQRAFLQRQNRAHPYLWSAFTLIGNWQ